MAVEYEISSDVATIKDVAPNTQVASIVKFYTGSITYDDEPTSKYASVTINGKTQRVMLCVAVSGTVNYDDVPCLYSTVDGHRTLNVVEPTESGTPDDGPSLYETVVVDGKTVRALRCVLINATPNYDGVSSTCTFVDNGKTHTAQLINQVGAGYIDEIVHGTSPLSLPDAVANSLQYVKAYGGTELTGTPTPSTPATITCNNGILKVKDSELPVGYKRLQNVKTSGNVRYVSNVYLTGDDTLRFSFQASPGNLLGSYNDSSANDNYSFYNTTGAASSYARYNGQTGGSATYTGTTYNVTISPTGITGTRNPSSFTPTEFTCSVPFCIFATSPTGLEHSNATIIGNIEVSGSQNLKFIPCERVSDGAIGYWETLNQEFLEKQGTGTPTTDGYDTSYMTEIYADGTVETIEDSIGNSATCEPLLSVGDYVDVQEILSGAVTRNVGVKVLDGTENWQLATATNLVQFYTSSTQGVIANSVSLVSTIAPYGCTVSNRTQYDFGCYSGSSGNLCFQMKGSATLTTTTAWTQYLTAQYAAGTPVIVIYPLAEPTTESVAGQTLQVDEGDNTLEITQASILDLELEAKYKKISE